jgi:phosphoglycolate phosphatase
VIKAVLFDLDGTLVDTAPDFVVAANALRHQLKLPPLADKFISAQVSNGSIAVTEVASEVARDNAQFKPLQQTLLNHYASVLGQHAVVYSGLTTLLEQLAARQLHWGIVTNKPLQYAQPLLKKLALHQSTTLICPDHVSAAKPSPEGLLLAAQQCEASAQQCIYVGDHQRDIEAGKAANMTTIAVGYGYLSSNDDPTLWQADYYCQTPLALCTLIDKLTA